MEIDLMPWISLAARWLHVIAGIAWIGSSFYFVWLDNSLEAPRQKKIGVAGELWSVHGGGFYHKQKYSVAPEMLPDHLHWFKWEAYTTWLSGFFLLVIIYYLNASIFLIDPERLALSVPQAVILGLTTLLIGWLLYHFLCRSRLGEDNRLLGLVWFLLLVGTSFLLTNVFSDRGAFIHVGALIGTVMAANVFFVIIPNQKKVVNALIAGNTPNPALGRRAKQRSVHNNYMTLPLLFLMISNHYPIVYMHPYNWLLMAGIGAASLLIRHFFNLRHKGKARPGLLLGGCTLFLGIAVAVSWPDAKPEAASSGTVVSFADVRPLLAKHCTSCHSKVPSHEAFSTPPANVRLDDEAHVRRNASRILEQAVFSKAMPLGGASQMTDAERAALGAWLKTALGGPKP